MSSSGPPAEGMMDIYHNSVSDPLRRLTTSCSHRTDIGPSIQYHHALLGEIEIRCANVTRNNVDRRAATETGVNDATLDQWAKNWIRSAGPGREAGRYDPPAGIKDLANAFAGSIFRSELFRIMQRQRPTLPSL